jgi:hypothetical protein
LGDAEVTTVKHSPSDAIPEGGQRPYEDCEISSIVGREESCNVFEDHNWGATRFNEFSKVVEESGLSASKSLAGSHSGKADVLAGEAPCPDFGFRDVIGIYLTYVSGTRHEWPVLLQNVDTEWLQLALPDGLQTGAFKAKIEPADTSKKARDPESRLLRPAGVLQ